MNDLTKLHYELKEQARQEAYKLWRLARRCKEHGVSQKTIDEIRNEAHHCHTTLTAYPERMVAWDFEYRMKWAFK